MKKTLISLIAICVVVFGVSNFAFADDKPIDEGVAPTQPDIKPEIKESPVASESTEPAKKTPEVTEPAKPKKKAVPYESIYKLSALCAPLSTAHLNGVYSFVGYGRMEQTATLPSGNIIAGLNINIASFSSYNDDENFDATFMGIELEARYGIIDQLEAGFRLKFGGWDGSIIVPGIAPNSEATTNLSDIILDVKYNFITETPRIPYAISALATIKLPTGSQDDVLSTGALDFSVNGLFSYYLLKHQLGLHALVGMTFAGDSDQIDADSLTLGALLNFGVGATYVVTKSDSLTMLAIWQMEFFDPNLDTTIGLRCMINALDTIIIPELAATIGLHKLSGDFTIHFGTKILF